jgi:glycerophosphoryl diester phosphodiesterase
MMKLISYSALAFVLTCYMACARNISTMPDKMQLNKQGHRGCRGLLPENTIAAMLKAVDLGVTTLELDVVITKDEKVILSHEPFFNHEITTKPDGTYVNEREEKSLNMYQMNYEDIIKYDIGLKPHPRFPKQQQLKAIKPLLKDVFDAVKEYCTVNKKQIPFFNIETKCLPITDNLYHPKPAPFVDLVMQVIVENKMEDYITIQSFDFRTLQYLQTKHPAIKTVMLIEDTDKKPFEEQIKVLGFYADVYSPHYSLVNEALVKKCHTHNMKLIPWTVNDKAEMNRLISLGVDGIITDYPNLFNE